MQANKYIIYADGGSRGNPGPAAFGYAILNEKGEVVSQLGECIGINTNNVAEYMGLIRALEKLAETDPNSEVEVRLDSQLAVRQMTGQYKIKQPHLQELAYRARLAAARFSKISYNHVYRNENKLADSLVNQALDNSK